MEAERLTCILDYCKYSYCQFTVPPDHWEQRSLHITRHCDLKAASELILILRKRGGWAAYKAFRRGNTILNSPIRLEGGRICAMCTGEKLQICLF